MIATAILDNIESIGGAILTVLAILAALGKFIIKPWIDRVAQNIKDEIFEKQDDLKEDVLNLKHKTDQTHEALKAHMQTEEITNRLFQQEMARLDARQAVLEAITGLRYQREQQEGKQ